LKINPTNVAMAMDFIIICCLCLSGIPGVNFLARKNFHHI
jgi:hypothetical protein